MRWVLRVSDSRVASDTVVSEPLAKEPITVTDPVLPTVVLDAVRQSGASPKVLAAAIAAAITSGLTAIIDVEITADLRLAITVVAMIFAGVLAPPGRVEVESDAPEQLVDEVPFA